MAKNKFNYGDLVKVTQNLEEMEKKYGCESVERMKKFQGREGLVTDNWIDDEEDDPINYSVAVFDEQGEIDAYAHFPEGDLEATGKKGDLNKIKMSSTHLRVSMDGRILGVYDDEEEI